jgi:uncharacterized protein (TIGR01319 family)
MGLTLAIDFGSTNTKVVALDLANAEVVGVAQSPSTVNTDITTGLKTALEKMQAAIGVKKLSIERTLACSSAAGGLRMVAIGLVRQLTTRVAEEAALGAGAKIVGTFSHGLNGADVKNVEQLGPDIILLTGGTDGGDEKTLLASAQALTSSCIKSPIVVAGNKKVASLACTVLQESGKLAFLAPNVLPELDQINVEPVRNIIREVFIKHIIYAKGLDKAKAMVDEIIMPTPMAVLNGARLLAEGTRDESGLGDLIVVDVGGATTNVHSLAYGLPSAQGVITKGLPEPFAKRTVEGDLGIRYNARVILQIAGSKNLLEKMAGWMRDIPPIDLEARTAFLSSNVSTLPQNQLDSFLDMALASTAIEIATRRHAGILKETYFPSGQAWIQKGKDLTQIKYVIGTGGILAYGGEPLKVIRAAGFDPHHPESLKPRDPQFYLDKRYILYAIGLLSQIAPAQALKIMKNNLLKLG